MSVRVAHHRKVTDDTAYIHRWLNQNILLPRQLGNSIDLFATVTLKPEVIQPGLHFILHDDQNENRIFRRCNRTEPDIVTTLKPAVAHDRETAERCVAVNRGVD